MEGIFVFAGVMVTITGVVFAFFKMPIGEAIVEHIRANSGSDSPTQERIERLEREVTQLQADVTEAQERLDFAERLLTKGEERK